jgi:acetyl esterase/lipase
MYTRIPKRLWIGVLCGIALASAVRADAPVSSVRPLLNIAYYEGKDTDPDKHKLDLYVPREVKDAPVLFFVHGGAWRRGDKQYLGLYSSLAMSLAHQGIIVVVPNYRLSPQVTHPEHIKDVARAFAWAYANIARYGGRRDEIFAAGHSAGAHLIALLATDESWLKAQGLELTAIRGVIAISGIYDLSDNNRLFDMTFGHDVSVRAKAAPLSHVCATAPPFLIMYAERDIALCGRVPSEEFAKALRAKNCQAATLELKDRNHFTELLDAVLPGDPAFKAIVGFVASHRRE